MKRIFLLFFIFLSACAKTEGTSTGNPLVALQFKSYTAMSVANLDALAVSNLTMCFKRLRFKPVSGLDENIDLALGEVAIVTSGTLVTTARVPAGTYSRVEFDLNSECVSGKSVQLVNGAGAFTSTQNITIRFDGMLTLSDNTNLDLDIQAIISALNTVTSDADIKIKAESIGGSF